ncbi:uncharacterized protein LOC130621162 isoform X1 [Hydractinia symbiolongicarpus]|uniref:uncharacterized protein LOC130621162 isoform X1 n=1 Tax=Hydractinia symbiolongicarpus TaxID=13093 RepID=UPI00254FF78D|nr:uncharacterized protein LOC130621162 isoform X1 [Hydractinia symbiolongicarpus]
MAKPKPQYSKQYTVVVENLSAETNKKALFLTFKDFGIIKSYDIALDERTGLPRRAFVNYKDLNAAQTAQKAMDNKKFCGLNVRTSLKINDSSISQSNKINFQPLTDCSFFEKGECNPKNGKVCPYRHNLLTDQPECSLWQSGKCQNVKCIYRHPKKVSAPPTETPVPTSRSSINPYSARPRTSGHKPSIRLNVGMDVAVEHDGKDLNGIVRWIGKIHSILKEDTFVGVELASPVSTGTDGTFHSQRFFSCQPGHAIFVKDSLCKAPLLLPIKVPARDGISVKEMNVCGHYLQNICRAGDKCDLMHPPVPSSFIWCFKQLGDVEYTCCSVNLNSEIEKAYCNPNSSKYKKAGSLEVNFELLGQCIYKSLPVSFKRFSTKSISVFPDEPMATTWKWYWLDDNQLWQEYLNEGSTRNDLIERAYHDWLHNGSTDIFKFNTLQFHYQLEFNTMHQVNLDPKYGTKRAVRRRPVLAAPTSRLSPDSSSPSTGRYPEHWPSTFPSCGYLLLKVDRNTTND